MLIKFAEFSAIRLDDPVSNYLLRGCFFAQSPAMAKTRFCELSLNRNDSAV
jgi:hypothetical protein